MIPDSTYLLPLAGVAVDTDLLGAILEGKVDVRLEDISVSLISVFELQAKTAKLGVPASTVVRAIRFIMRAFNTVPFYRPEIVETSHELRKQIPDYIDCVIVATAIALKEDLATEDTLIHNMKKMVEETSGIRVLSYRDLVKTE